MCPSIATQFNEWLKNIHKPEHDDLSPWLIVGSVAAAIATAFFAIQRQRHETLRHFHKLFDSFNERFEKLIPTLNQAERISLYDPYEVKEKINQYFDLCSEEYFFFKNGHIDPSAWNAWSEGMRRLYCENATIRAEWLKLCSTNRSAKNSERRREIRCHWGNIESKLHYGFDFRRLLVKSKMRTYWKKTDAITLILFCSISLFGFSCAETAGNPQGSANQTIEATSSAPMVAWKDLVENAPTYKGKTIRLKALYAYGSGSGIVLACENNSNRDLISSTGAVGAGVAAMSSGGLVSCSLDEVEAAKIAPGDAVTIEGIVSILNKGVFPLDGRKNYTYTITLLNPRLIR